MKLFFDTNVIISAFATKGYSFDVIKDSIYKHEVYYTDYLLKEVQNTLRTKFSLPKKIINNTSFIIKKYFIKGIKSDRIEKVCRDSDDDRILADALINKIEILITGDKDLLVLKNYKGINIISPKDYWNL